MVNFSKDELKLIEHAKSMVIKYNKLRNSKDDLDTLYSFLMSNSGKMYDGACLETNISSGTICGERHAIANLVLSETYKSKIKHILVADPVPSVQKTSTTPCGTCRHVIWERGTSKTTVLCMQYIKQKNGWHFPKIQKHVMKDLYPFAYTPIKWD